MAGYIGPAPVPQATQTREVFTLSSTQTTVGTGGYTPGFVDVYLNGAKLAPADFTATNGSDIVLASGAAANDILEVVAFQEFTVVDQTFSGDITFTGASYNLVWDASDNALEFADNAKATFGAGSDLQIYHDGSHSYIDDTGTGRLYLRGSDRVQIQKYNSDSGLVEDGISFLEDGAVKLYHNNSNKLETTSTGVAISGQVFTNVIGRSDDTNTTIDFPGSDVIETYTAGVLRTTLNSSGNLGIGVSPSGARLHVDTAVAGYAAKFVNDNTATDANGVLIQAGSASTEYALNVANTAGSTNFLVVKGNGNTGIGESNPLAKLQISTTSGESDIRLHRTDTAIANDDIYGNIFFSGDDSDTNANGIRGFIRGKAQGTGGGMKLEFGTAGGGVAIGSDPRMTINADGNVGIGVSPTTAYGSALQIHDTGTAGANLRLTDSNTGSGTGNGMELIAINADNYWINRETSGVIYNIIGTTQVYKLDSSGFPSFTGASDIRLTLGSTGTAGTNSASFLRGNGATLQYNSASGSHLWEVGGSFKMVLDSSGNLGIGTSSPNNKLDVNGGIVCSPNTDGKNTFELSTHAVNEGRLSIKNVDTTTVQIRAGGDSYFNGGKVLVGCTSFGDDGISMAPRYSGLSTTSQIRWNRASSSQTGSALQFLDNSQDVGSINYNNSSTSFNTSSDYRLKENVSYSWDATTRLKQLKPARFNFIVSPDKTVDGFLAHEVSSIVPEAITGEKDAIQVWESAEELPEGVSVGDNKLDADGNTIPALQSIDQSKLVPLLVKTILELEARITALEAGS